MKESPACRRLKTVHAYLSVLYAACLLLPTGLLAADIASCGQKCPPGPCECVPPPAISDSENGSGFMVEGGKPNFKWSACGDYTVSEDRRSIAVTDSSKCCGAGKIAVTDACNRVATKPVEFNRDLELVPSPTNTNVWTGVQASTIPFKWEFCGTLDLSADTRTATITSTEGCCGTYNIKVRGACDKEVEAVAGTIPTLSVAGFEDAAVGTDYNAIGGSPPYTWSFNKGTIDSNGTIMSINTCTTPGETRTGLVTVTDSCGMTESIEVRLSSGSWVRVNTVCSPSGSNGPCIEPNPGCGTKRSVTCINGGVKVEHYYKSAGLDCPQDYCTPASQCPGCERVYYGGSFPCNGETNNRPDKRAYCKYQTITYEWRCQ